MVIFSGIWALPQTQPFPNSWCIGHHGWTQGKYLAGNGLAGAIAEGDMDRAILDGQRTYMTAHNLLLRWQSCGGIVGWEGM